MFGLGLPARLESFVWGLGFRGLKVSGVGCKVQGRGCKCTACQAWGARLYGLGFIRAYIPKALTFVVFLRVRT